MVPAWADAQRKGLQIKLTMLDLIDMMKQGSGSAPLPFYLDWAFRTTIYVEESFEFRESFEENS